MLHLLGSIGPVLERRAHCKEVIHPEGDENTAAGSVRLNFHPDNAETWNVNNGNVNSELLPEIFEKHPTSESPAYACMSQIRCNPLLFLTNQGHLFLIGSGDYG